MLRQSSPGLLTLSLGLLLTTTSFLFTPEIIQIKPLESISIKIGILLTYIGLQLRIFEVIGKEFITRHEKEYELRNMNVKVIYDAGEKKLAPVPKTPDISLEKQ